MKTLTSQKLDVRTVQSDATMLFLFRVSWKPGANVSRSSEDN